MTARKMTMDFLEETGFALRSLYQSYGYNQYKMSKFEVYDLYAENKDFLISDSVITFMDRNGKLMALKPDVTLSIVKNTKLTENALVKMYYHENIYRVAKASKQFRELPQIGLECLGDVDAYCICEVLTLAAKSLQLISSESVLSVSDLGIINSLLDRMGLDRQGKNRIISALGEKNAHALQQLAVELGISNADVLLLKQLMDCNGEPQSVLQRLESLCGDRLATDALTPLKQIVSVLQEKGFYPMVRLDLSVVDNVHYYNGIVFKGFVYGVPDSVLSGGQYDKLMEKMKKGGKAIGFAVYMDALQLLAVQEEALDADILLVYGQCNDFAQLDAYADQLREQGNTVAVRKEMSSRQRFGKCLQWCGKEVKEIG